jgi:hypothetical protein
MNNIAPLAKDSSRLTADCLDSEVSLTLSQAKTAEAARAVVFLNQQSNPAQGKTKHQQDYKKDPARRRDFLFLHGRRLGLAIGTLEGYVVAQRRAEWSRRLVSAKRRGNVRRRAVFGFGGTLV